MPHHASTLVLGDDSAKRTVVVEPWGMHYALEPGERLRCTQESSRDGALFWEVLTEGEYTVAWANGPVDRVRVEKRSAGGWSTLQALDQAPPSPPRL